MVIRALSELGTSKLDIPKFRRPVNAAGIFLRSGSIVSVRVAEWRSAPVDRVLVTLDLQHFKQACCCMSAGSVTQPATKISALCCSCQQDIIIAIADTPHMPNR